MRQRRELVDRVEVPAAVLDRPDVAAGLREDTADRRRNAVVAEHARDVLARAYVEVGASLGDDRLRVRITRAGDVVEGPERIRRLRDRLGPELAGRDRERLRRRGGPVG